MNHFDQNKYDLIEEKDCFDLVRDMILTHGIDVIYPCLIAMRAKLNREDCYGEPEELS